MATALVTGVSRERGIGTAIALRLAEQGWDLGLTWWLPADAGLAWAGRAGEPRELVARLQETGANVAWHEDDLQDPEAPGRVFAAVEDQLGAVSALVNVHAVSLRGGVMDTSAEDFDLHMAVNARASLLLIRELAARLPAGVPGRVVSLTSDALHGELAYGASKAALDRITAAAARELGPRGITVNAVNPGPNDTGWMEGELKAEMSGRTPLGRVGRPRDTAALVAFLLSEEGGWVSGQVLRSDGGFSA